MWIKAIYCTKDTNYAERLVRFLDHTHGGQIEVITCSSMERFFDAISQNRVDVALFDSGFEQEVLDRNRDIPCTCGLLTEQIYEEQGGGLTQIPKYQHGEEIYKNILDLYSSGEKVKRIVADGKQKADQKIYVFVSASGGSGTSTIAKAYARRCAAYEKVLYLDLGLFNTTGVTGGNANGMDEVILALKSRRNILPLKLASAVSSTADRVYTYGPCSNEVNLLELDAADAGHLMEEMIKLSEYRKVIVDLGSSIAAKEVELMKYADRIVCILEENDIGKEKYKRFCIFLEQVGEKEQMRVIKKMVIFRNKVRKTNENGFQGDGNRVIGWAPYVSRDSYDAVVDRIARSDSFSNMEIRDGE